MNNMNQVTPYGNLTYSQTGTNFINDANGQDYWKDPSGNYTQNGPAMSGATAGTPGHWDFSSNPNGNSWGNHGNQTWVPGTAGTAGTVPAGWTKVHGDLIPSYTATQTMSPQQKAIFDQDQAAQLNLAKLSNEQSAKMEQYLQTPVDLSSANIDKYSNTHWMNGFNNTWDRNQQQFNQRQADLGVHEGSEAYTNALRDFSTNKTAANDQFLGDMYDRSVNDILTQRNQPINEISALLGQTGVHQPTYAGQSSTSALPTVDVAGLQQQQFANQSQNYQQQLANSNAAMGGLFGLAGAGLGGWAKTGFAMSDRRLKNDIVKIGTLKNGLGIYEYNYIWGGERQTGVMADEVRKVMPDAVFDGALGGFDMVDYGKVLEAL